MRSGHTEAAVDLCKLAGLPPVYGLYASIVPTVAYALFGTSRHMPVGPPALMALLTFSLGYVGSRRANTTPDFLVARRAVPATRNAAAISGEYLSAASFLGVAGLVLKDGVDALWYPIGFTAGYLAMMLFVAAPLRRSGAYTLPDFAEARLGPSNLRKFCTFFVICIGVLYLVPQLQSAGLTLNTITGLPAWLGGVVVTVIVVVNVLGGGMRAITLVQAFQYWGKLFAIAAPTFQRHIGFSGHAGVYAWGMATAKDGSILVGDYWNYSIRRYSTDGRLLQTISERGTGVVLATRPTPGTST